MPPALDVVLKYPADHPSEEEEQTQGQDRSAIDYAQNQDRYP